MVGLLEYSDAQDLCKEYDYDAFMGSQPYQLLRQVDDELTRERLTAALRERALKCGVSAKTFDMMVRALKKDMKTEEAEEKKRQKEEKKQEAEQDAEAQRGTLEGLSEMLKGTPCYGKYICTDQRVFYLGFYGEEVQVCGHPIFPTGRYVNVETGSELMDISYKLDGRWHTKKLVDRKIISQSRTITALSEYGMDITSENAKDVVRFLAEMDTLNRNIIPRRKTVARLGWVDGYGFSPYIEGVEYDSSGKYEDAYAAVHEEGSFDVWKETAGKVMADKQYLPARIVMAASVASVVLKWTSQQPFMVHLWGTESGTGKTISLMLAASMWADPVMGRFMRSLNATKVANEQLAGFCNNMPLILDELQTIQKSVDFDDIIYMLCEGTGRARGARDGGLREQSRWMNVIITNGEQPISADGRAGAVNRVISIETSEKIIPGDMGDFADTIRNNYGHAGKAIIERILKQEDFKSTIRDTFNALKRELSKSVTGKQANYGAALLVGDALLNSIIFGGCGYPRMTAEDILPFLATQEMVDTNQKAKDWLVGFVASNASRFRRFNDDTPVGSEIYGEVTDEGDVKIIRSVLKEQMERRGWTLASFIKWCDERGLVFTNHSKTNRHWEVWSQINGLKTGTYVLHFKAIMFKDSGTPVEISTPFD